MRISFERDFATNVGLQSLGLCHLSKTESFYLPVVMQHCRANMVNLTVILFTF